MLVSNLFPYTQDYQGWNTLPERPSYDPEPSFLQPASPCSGGARPSPCGTGRCPSPWGGACATACSNPCFLPKPTPMPTPMPTPGPIPRSCPKDPNHPDKTYKCVSTVSYADAEQGIEGRLVPCPQDPNHLDPTYECYKATLYTRGRNGEALSVFHWKARPRITGPRSKPHPLPVSTPAPMPQPRMPRNRWPTRSWPQHHLPMPVHTPEPTF